MGQLDEPPVIRYRRDGDGPDGPRWLVVADGDSLGYVQQARVRHGRPTHKGSRIVSGWTYSNRWKAEGGASRVYWDTRWEAAASVIERTLGLPWYEAREAAKSGRAQSKADPAASPAAREGE